MVTPPPPSRPALVHLFVVLVAGTIATQFFRIGMGVIVPDLAIELALTPAAVGLLNSSLFLALAVLQLPVGVLIDRHGARVVTGTLTGLAVVGAGLFAAAPDFETALAARVLMGLGGAATFTGAMIVLLRWHPKDRFAGVLAWYFAASNIGNFMGTLPLSWAAAEIGWRAAHWIACAFTLGSLIWFWVVVRDHPPGRAPPAGRPASLRAAVAGVATVLANRDMRCVLAINFVGYASTQTILALWGASWLRDVHGLDAVARGWVLLAGNLGAVAGNMVWGPLDRRLDSRRRVVTMAALALAGTVSALALWPSPPVIATVPLLFLLGAGAAMAPVVIAHARGLTPDAMAARTITIGNIAMLMGVFTAQASSGLLLDLLTEPGQATPERAYRMLFAALALAVLAAIVVYRRARDVPPSSER
jgi:predicted MFS family arabinose efflux permease